MVPIRRQDEAGSRMKAKSLKVHPTVIYPLKPYLPNIPNHLKQGHNTNHAKLRVADWLFLMDTEAGIREGCVPDLWLQCMP